MRILVTGGAGFIGSPTGDAPLAPGPRRRGPARPGPPGPTRARPPRVAPAPGAAPPPRPAAAAPPPAHAGGRPPYLPPEVELVRGSVADRAVFRQALEGIEAVFHLAAYQDYLTDFSTFFLTNS